MTGVMKRIQSLWLVLFLLCLPIFADTEFKIIHPQLGEMTLEEFFEGSLERVQKATTTMEREDLAKDFESRLRKIGTMVKVGDAETAQLEKVIRDFHEEVRTAEALRRADQGFSGRLAERFKKFLHGAVRLTLGLTTQTIGSLIVGAGMIYAIVCLDLHPAWEFDLFLATVPVAVAGGYVIKRKVGTYVGNRRHLLHNPLSYRYSCREMVQMLRWR